MGTCSNLKGLLSRRYKDAGTSDIDIQPNSSSRDEEIGNKNVNKVQLGLTRYEVTFLVHIGGGAIALNAGNQVHLPLVYPIFADVKLEHQTD
jgi:hypothetical protein